MDDTAIGPSGRPLPESQPTLENNRGQRIRTLAQWKQLAPPASPMHWREYRSAYELAHAWTEGDGANVLHRLLAGHPQFAGLRLDRAIAERKTYFDDIPGGPRNHDLLVQASTTAGPVVIGVEAKADETFDRDLTTYAAAANPRSRAPERLDRLTRAFFGTTLDADPSLAPLRYQLLSALAGTLVEAHRVRAIAAILVVHEFTTPQTDRRKQQANAADLDAFLTRLSTTPWDSRAGQDWLAGPFAPRGHAPLPYRLPVFVGKLHTHVPLRPHSALPESRAAAPISIPAPSSSGSTARRIKLAIPSGATVIKVNIHPPSCTCGCTSKGEIPFMLNQPGDGLRPTRKYHADEVVRQAREWALDALRARGRAPARPSDFELRPGMTTVTLTVHTDGAMPSFVAKHWNTGEEHAGQDLDAALAHIRRWCDTAARHRP